MVVLDTKPTIELLREQAALPTDQHFILRQHLDRKKKPTLRLEDRRKSFLWLISLVCIICVILAVVASLNPVPVFSGSKGLLSVVSLYPNSSLPRKDRVDPEKAEKDTRPKPKADHELAERGEAKQWNAACGCYESAEGPKWNEYDATTFTTTTATGLITHSPKPTRKPKPKPKPEDKPQGVQVDPGAFAGLFLGLTGACLQRHSGVLVCTSNSFSPRYSEIYDIAGLAANVTAQLPTGTGGASIGLLIAIVTYVLTTVAFVISALPRAWFYGPRGHKALGTSGKLPDLRHQWTLIFATGLAAISTFTIVASSIQLQNAFGASAEAVEAWDKTNALQAKLLTAYRYLYACAILSGAAVVSSLVMIAYDFQHPWWMPRAKEERSRLEALPEGAGPTGFVGGNRFDGGGGPGRSRVDSWNTGGDDDAMTVIGGNRRAPALHSE